MSAILVFVETADGALRIVLNASQSNRTLSSRFVEEFFGSGVQHIAFSCADIHATAAKLRANGVELLPIGVPDRFVPHGSQEVLHKSLGLDAESLTFRFRRYFAAAKASTPGTGSAEPAAEAKSSATGLGGAPRPAAG